MLIDIIHLVNGVKGYVIYSIRRKLKKQYAHLKGSQIMKLKQSGTEVSCAVLLNWPLSLRNISHLVFTTHFNIRLRIPYCTQKLPSQEIQSLILFLTQEMQMP
jgi:hypothetical protein